MFLHTYYRYPGGEDVVVTAELALLRERGHDVMELAFNNNDLEALALWRQGLATIWNHRAFQEAREAIRNFHPEILHIHNTFPLASPAVIRAAKAEGIPVVMTLHNYRLLCINALLFREGGVCEECLGKTLPWPGVIHGCWRGRGASAATAGMLGLHRLLGTWDSVDGFIALTAFAREKFIQGGLPWGKIHIKPNFVYPDPAPGDGRKGHVLFVGRLSLEKGVRTLLRAWEILDGSIPLIIVGDGPLALDVRQATEHLPSLEWLGRQSLREVYSLMGESSFLVFPSEWYEGFPRVLVEAFARGLPVVASGLGSQASIVENGRTGFHFRPGDPEDLAAKVTWLMEHPKELSRMRKEARAEYEAKYTAERNYQILMKIYERAIEAARQS